MAVSAAKEAAGGNADGGAPAAAEAVVLAEGPYSSGVLVALDPTRPTVLKLTIGGREASGAGEAPGSAVVLLGAVDG